MECIKVSDLVKTYGELTAVDHISFQAEGGEILGILGPNGSGKTTTVKSILGLINFDSGSITVDGMDVRKQRRRILEKTGAVLEGARNTYWFMSPRENLSYFAGIKGVARSDAQRNIEYLIKRLDMEDVADKELREFSSGMKQKCALACAFVHAPEILLLDEPTLGLDVEISRSIRDWLLEIVREQGKTILITSHNMDFVESVCDRILIIRRGKIISHETVESLKSRFAGKFYQFTLDRDPPESLVTSMRQFGGVFCSGSVLRVELRSLDLLLDMVRAVSGSGCVLRDFKTVENDLEDIFLDMIREEEE